MTTPLTIEKRIARAKRKRRTLADVKIAAIGLVGWWKSLRLARQQEQQRWEQKHRRGKKGRGRNRR